MVLVTKTKHKKRPSPATNGRRGGQHHKRNDHYLKTYWPYIPIAAIVTLGLVANTFLGHVHKSVLGYATSMSVAELLNDTNTERGDNGLGGLTINAQLNSAAQAKANDMVARDYWSHNTPDGDAPWVFFVNAGYNYQTAGENLAYGFDSSATAVTAWMNSPEHRANILNSTYKDVGFGFANSSNYQGTGPETIVVAEYGSSQQQVAAAPTASDQTPAISQPSTTPAAAPSTPADSEQPQVKPAETNTTNLTESQNPTTTAGTVASKNVSRIQVLSGGNASWTMFAVTSIATLSLAIFFLRHGLLWHRVLVKGESFVMHHRLLDVTLVLVIVIGFVITRSAGIIR